MENNKFKIILIGVIFDPKTRKILIGKNKDDENYSFLEGNLTCDEELDISIKSIAKEKTGYVVHNLGTIYARNNIENDKEKLEIYFLCEATEGSEKPGENVEELKWIKPSEIAEYINGEMPSRLKEYITHIG